TANTVLPVGQWRHVLLTYDGSGKAAGITLFVDGRQIRHSTGTSRLQGSIRSPNPVSLGARGTSFPFSGAIDEVSLFSRALNAAEAERLAAATWPDLVLATPEEGRSPELQREVSRLRGERVSSAALISTLKQRDDLAAEIGAQGGELAL